MLILQISLGLMSSFMFLKKDEMKYLRAVVTLLSLITVAPPSNSYCAHWLQLISPTFKSSIFMLWLVRSEEVEPCFPC